MNQTLRFLPCLAVVVACCLPGPCPGADAAGELQLILRDRVAVPDEERFEVRERGERWDPKHTALIICDMWDVHHCKRAVERVLELAPQMNQVIARARDRGALVIHAPSSCMAPYETTPMRRRAREAPTAKNLPADIGSWCRKIPAEDKGRYPIDQTDGGEDDEPAEHAAWAAHLTALGRNPRAPWKSQVDLLTIDERDAVSDSGVEIWNLLEQRGIRHVVLMGVHTNMCVLGRPFGLRQLAKNGRQVVLMRDMTDTMYNPARWPYVSHFRGTDLIVEHIEKFVCPTVTSDQLLGGKPFRFRKDVRPLVVMAIAEEGYRTGETLPAFARDELQDRLGVDVEVVKADPKTPHAIPGLAEAVSRADLLLLSVRRQALPEKDLEAVRRHLAAGKPLVGLRTASHAFDARGQAPAGHAEWAKFDTEVLGGSYRGDRKEATKAEVTAGPEAEKHPVLRGVRVPFPAGGSLYQFGPLTSSAVPLLTAAAPDGTREPVAWTHQVGRARVVYTSLGHPDDFRTASFRRLLTNAVLWALDQPVPAP